MAKLSIRDLDVRGKRVFIRVDFNVPIKEGRIKDDTRVRASLPTIKYALEHGATVILASHLGRPKGGPSPEFSLEPVAAHLARLLDQAVSFATDCVGEPARKAIEQAQAQGHNLVVLENVRFHKEEEKNDPAFAKQLAELADLYVNDAFGSSHRAHASTEGMAHLLPQAAAGFLMEDELKYLGLALASPERPFVAVLGGAKVSDKIDVIENFLGRVDVLLIGGAMAYTFFKAKGLPVGKSLVEDDKLDAARAVMAKAAERGVRLELPVDHVVAEKIEAGVATAVMGVEDPAIGERMGLDIGPKTAAQVRRDHFDREDRGVERADGRVRDQPVRRGDNRRGQGRGRREGHNHHRRRRLRVGSGEGRRDRQDHAHLDRRRRVARVPRRRRAARSGGAH